MLSKRNNLAKLGELAEGILVETICFPVDIACSSSKKCLGRLLLRWIRQGFLHVARAVALPSAATLGACARGDDQQDAGSLQD